MNRIAFTDDGGLDYLDWRPGSGRSVEIFDIAVDGKRRREGRGRKLIARLLREIPSETSLVFAVARIGNEIAAQFYEAAGFRLLGRLHNFYRDGGLPGEVESALVFGLDL